MDPDFIDPDIAPRPQPQRVRQPERRGFAVPPRPSLRPQPPIPPAPTHTSPQSQANHQNTRPADAPAEKVEPKKPRRGLKIALITTLVAVLMLAPAGVGAWWYINNQQKPEKVANKMLSAVVANNPSLANTLVSEDFTKETSSDKLAEVIKQISPFFQNQSVIVDRTVEKPTPSAKQRAAVVYKTQKDGNTYYIKLILVKENGKWLVYNLESKDSALSASLEP